MLFLPKQLKRKKQLSFQYWLALVIIFIAVIIPILVQEYVILKQENYAYIINISGRQRMLSQRTTLLARELVSSENLSRQKQVRDKLLEATELMEKSHFILVTGQLPGNKQVINSDKVINLYHEYPLALDRKVKQHITLMRRILSTENFTQSKLMFDPFTLSGLEKQNLLASLNKMVKQYEVESNRYTEMVKIIQLTAVIIILLTLGGAVFFIFRPMIRTVVQHEGMLNNILDTIPVLMDVVDEDHIIQYQSKKLIELMGHDSIGKTCYSVYKDDNQLCHHCPIKSTNNSSSLEVNHCLGNRTLNITHVDIQFNDKKAVLEVFHDVSAQKKTHDLLLQAKNSAEQANLLKSEFLANMSHEIRTPMNGVLGLTSLLQETKLNLEQQELVTAIESSADTLMVIINDILDFSKVEAGETGFRIP